MSKAYRVELRNYSAVVRSTVTPMTSPLCRPLEPVPLRAPSEIAIQPATLTITSCKANAKPNATVMPATELIVENCRHESHGKYVGDKSQKLASPVAGVGRVTYLPTDRCSALWTA